MNPLSDEHRERLSGAMEHSYAENAWARQSYRRVVEDFAGSFYGQGNTGHTKPETLINLIQELVRALKTALAYNDPQYVVTSMRSEFESFGQRFQTALNTYVAKIHFGDTLREIISDAIFLVGIGKIYLKDSAEVYHENDVWMDPGMPYLGRVSLDNFCYDVSKSDFRRAQFIADRYYMDFETAKECQYFDPEVRADLEPSRVSDREDRWETTASISSKSDNTDSEIEDVIDLVDVYLPKERVVCTWPVHSKFSLMPTKPLAVLPWDGPETGPYRFLSFVDVPDNIMPTSPAQSLCSLFYLHDFLMRRIARRAKQAKTILPYEPGAGEDMAKLMDAQDMQTVKVARIKSIEAINIPGPDQSLVNFTLGLQEQFNRAAGNIEAMTGTGPTADTVGGMEMIDSKVGAQLADYRKKVNRFASECGQDIGSLLFDDPMQIIPGEREVPGTDYKLNSDWLPPDMMERKCTFAELGVTVEPYSMEYKSPQQRLSQMFAVLGQVGPLIPLAQEQGMEFQFSAFIEDVAELSDEPRIKKWFRAAPPPMTEPGEQPAMRPPGTGQYTRTSVSGGATSAGRLQQLTQQQPQQPIMAGSSR
jgi:hypothetical protein